MAARGPQNGWRGLERCLPLGFWHSKQLSPNKFLGPSPPSMRKGRDGKKRRKEKNAVFSGHYVIASSLPPERLRPNDDRWNAARSCQFRFLLIKKSPIPPTCMRVSEQLKKEERGQQSESISNEHCGEAPMEARILGACRGRKFKYSKPSVQIKKRLNP